ncbi:MAG: hypothetical protein GY953_35805 [bacterium]|nr:hypothetical protein [bacterium]
MRLTGETSFCSPEHRRLHQEEHSRIGLERLLEELADGGNAPAAEVPEPEPAAEEASVEVPEAEPVADTSRDDARLWTYPALKLDIGPLIASASSLEFEPVAYVRGEPGASKEWTQTEELTDDVEPAAPLAPEEAEPEPDNPDPAVEEPRQPKSASGPEDEGEPVEFEFGGLANQRPAGREKVALRRIAKLLAAATLAAAVGVAGYLGVSRSESFAADPGGAATEAQLDGDWIANWSESGRGEHIALFGPSREWSDYMVESATRPDREVAWVFRAKDPANYCSLVLRGNVPGEVLVVRKTVIDGGSGEMQQTAFTMPSTLDSYGVKLEVRGSEFTLFLEGRRVADWTDPRLERGGFGVISPSLDFAQRKSVKVTRLAGNSVFKAKPPGASSELAAITITRMDSARTGKSPEAKESN